MNFPNDLFSSLLLCICRSLLSGWCSLNKQYLTTTFLLI